ncbi:MAG: acyltransferase [Bacteroidales bacterium]|nr:acyltransferase [Bacteroidales bacterium]
MIFSNGFSSYDFQKQAIALFHTQFENNPIYRAFCQGVGCIPEKVQQVADIPCLPIEFFKTQKVVTGTWHEQTVFTSSGTTGMTSSKHYVKDLQLYEKSCLEGFRYFYDDPKEWAILALLPSYLEREGSSLINMVKLLMQQGNHPLSGWFLNDYTLLKERLEELEKMHQKTLLLGVTYALLDFSEQFPMPLRHTIVMETGGMKGRRKEMIKSEIHHQLQQQFQTATIHSEYGMAELFSQAYSTGNGIFQTPPWMRVLIRDAEDPLSAAEMGKSGGINIIDLANRDSCAFIATQDLGHSFSDGTFEILGRFDHSDIRGCNLLVAE